MPRTSSHEDGPATDLDRTTCEGSGVASPRTSGLPCPPTAFAVTVESPGNGLVKSANLSGTGSGFHEAARRRRGGRLRPHRRVVHPTGHDRRWCSSLRSSKCGVAASKCREPAPPHGETGSRSNGRSHTTRPHGGAGGSLTSGRPGRSDCHGTAGTRTGPALRLRSGA
jgi:hypothetical protein